MRVLVIGASGQIGGHLFRSLQSSGHAVAGTYSSVAQPGLVQLDLGDVQALTAAVRDVAPDVVVLSAGWTWVDGNEDDPDKSHLLNCEAPLAAARQCREQGALFVTYSTDYVFDGQAGPYPEEASTAPLNVYGEAKLALERALAEELPGQHLLLRTTTVFGPETQGKNFVYQLVRRLRQGQPFVVPSDQLATPSYGPDVAAATLALIEQGARGTWHTAGPELLGRDELARLACEVFGLDFGAVGVKTTAELGQKARRPLRAGLATDKLTAAGIRIRAVRQALEAMRQEIEGGRAVGFAG